MVSVLSSRVGLRKSSHAVSLRVWGLLQINIRALAWFYVRLWVLSCSLLDFCACMSSDEQRVRSAVISSPRRLLRIMSGDTGLSFLSALMSSSRRSWRLRGRGGCGFSLRADTWRDIHTSERGYCYHHWDRRSASYYKHLQETFIIFQRLCLIWMTDYERHVCYSQGWEAAAIW